MAAPPAPTEAQWLQILDAIAWTLARIVIGFTPPNEAGRSWAFANAWSTPRTGTWAREFCNEGYRAYDAAVAHHGERAADDNVAGDAVVEAQLGGLPPPAAVLLSKTLREDAAREWQLMPAAMRAEWVAHVQRRNRGRRPATWPQAGSGPAIVPQIGMPNIGETPMIGEVGPDGVYRLRPRPPDSNA